MRETTMRFTANGAGVADASARVEAFLTEQRLGGRETERLRRTVELLLRRIGDRLGRATECELTTRRRLGRAEICIRYAGAEFDPTTLWREEAGNSWSERLLAEQGLVPEWSRRRGVNCLTLRPRRREDGVWLWQGGALLLAAVFSLTLPAPWLDAAERWALHPVCELFYRAWGILDGALVFFSAVSIVCGVGDTLSLGRPARRMLGRFAALTLLWTALGAAAFAPLLPTENAARGTWAERLWTAAGALVPGDPVSPFLHANVPQLLLLAFVTGMALTMLGGRAALVRDWSEQCACLSRALAGWLCRLTPLLLFCAAPRLARSAAPRELWRPVSLLFLLALAAAAIKLLTVCAKRRENPARLLKTLLPLMWTAFRGASSDMAFGGTLDVCENELGVPHDRLLLALPVGNVLCAPISALCCPALALCLARGGETAVSAVQLAALSLTGALLATALPRVPGARLLGLWLLLRPLAPSWEGFALAAVLCALFDAFAAAMGSAYLPLELLWQTGSAAAKRE